MALEPIQEEPNHLKNVVTGVLMGALLGGSMGWGVCVYLIDGTLLFPGDTVLLGAIVCGTLGFFWGESFIEWLQEEAWWFW